MSVTSSEFVWDKTDNYYPPKIWRTAIYKGWWTFFITENFIIWILVFIFSVRKLYKLHGIKFNRYFNTHLGTFMLLLTTISSICKYDL